MLRMAPTSSTSHKDDTSDLPSTSASLDIDPPTPKPDESFLQTLDLQTSHIAVSPPFRISNRTHHDMVLSQSAQHSRILGPRHDHSHSSGGSGSGGSGGSGGGGGGNNTIYWGCLNMTIDELDDAWNWRGEMPVCTGGISDSSSSGTFDEGQPPPISVDDCESYSNVWLWDLALTCKDLSTLEGCNCEFAKELHHAGGIVCAEDLTTRSPPTCPEGCSVCETCMALQGCEQFSTTLSAQRYSSFLAYLLASAAGVAMGGLALYMSRKKRGKRKSMGSVAGLPANLIDLEPPQAATEPTGSDNVWLAPIS